MDSREGSCVKKREKVIQDVGEKDNKRKRERLKGYRRHLGVFIDTNFYILALAGRETTHHNAMMDSV